MNWFERRLRRQYELDSGVAADFVRENEKRYRLSVGLFVFGFALGLLVSVSKGHLPHTLRLIVTVVATVAMLGGLVLGAWARQEAAFLSEPKPEEPPKMFK
jgi:hypothetical protein